MVFYKREESRFGILIFKALGGAYEVKCLLRGLFQAATWSPVSIEDLEPNRDPDLAAGVTMVNATGGKHGHSVASRAPRFGSGGALA